MSYSFTDQPGEEVFDFVILNDVEQLLQHFTRILDCPGETPNIINVSILYNSSSFLYWRFADIQPIPKL